MKSTALAIGLFVLASGCGGPQQPIAIVTAMPSELSAVLAFADVTETQTIDGHIYRVGTIGTQPVVMTMTGIGLVNARKITTALLDHFQVSGIVFSGVAGSRYDIGDVTVPDTWTLTSTGESFPVDAQWLTVARGLVGTIDPMLDACTDVPADPTMHVCIPVAPNVEVGGEGKSADTFGGTAFHCDPFTDDVYGCDIGGPAGMAPTGLTLPADPDPPVAQDEETASVARIASMRGVRFIAFRAVSDGMNDPLMLPGFPGQFFTYYRLAAHNAAVAAVAFLARL